MQRLPEGSGVNKIKGKRRDLQRLLNKPGLSAEKKREVERALQVLAGDLENALNRNKTKKIAQKYHMVRFFERKKALRAIKKSTGATELADFYYVTEFPKDKKYVALYAEGSKARESQFYNELKEKAKEGKLKVPKQESKSKPKTKQVDDKNKNKNANEDSNDDSDTNSSDSNNESDARSSDSNNESDS